MKCENSINIKLSHKQAKRKTKGQCWLKLEFENRERERAVLWLAKRHNVLVRKADMC